MDRTDDGWINLAEAAKVAGIAAAAMSLRVTRGTHKGEVRRINGQVLVKRQDVEIGPLKGGDGGGRPRGDIPFIERRPSGSWRWRRKVPDDLKPILGEAWTHVFPVGMSLELIRAASEGLARQTDDIITERRARLRGALVSAPSGGAA